MILVFAGAGASSAIEPDLYPTTEGFFNRVPETIRNNPWFEEVSLFLQSIDSTGKIDIEDVLGALRKMQEYCDWSLDTKRFPGWVLEPGQNRYSRLGRTSNGDQDEYMDYDPFASLDYIVRSLIGNRTSLDELQGAINALVYGFYAATPRDESLQPWVTLLQSLESLLESRNHPTQVFTTNYDLVLENAIRVGSLEESIGTGRVSDVKLEIDLDKWRAYSDRFIDPSGAGLLTKLHGSVDWQQDIDGRIVVGASHFTGQHENHILIYPGFKGEPEKDPFMTFHNHLRLVAANARAAIFIGYAFRDEYINEILSSMPSHTLKIVIDAEQSKPDREFLRNCSYSGDGFKDESLSFIFGVLTKSGIA